MTALVEAVTEFATMIDELAPRIEGVRAGPIDGLVGDAGYQIADEVGVASLAEWFGGGRAAPQAERRTGPSRPVIRLITCSP